MKKLKIFLSKDRIKEINERAKEFKKEMKKSKNERVAI